MSPESIIQHQLETYNARDLDAYLALFSETIQTFVPPDAEPVLDGKQAFGRFYASQRFNLPELHAELLHRNVLGNTVIDLERIHGVKATPMEMVAVYQVDNALIQAIWFYYRS